MNIANLDAESKLEFLSFKLIEDVVQFRALVMAGAARPIEEMLAVIRKVQEHAAVTLAATHAAGADIFKKNTGVELLEIRDTAEVFAEIDEVTQ